MQYRIDPWVRKISWRRKWQPTPLFLPGKSHGQKSLAGYSPKSRKESDMTEWLNIHHHHAVIKYMLLSYKFLYSLIWRMGACAHFEEGGSRKADKVTALVLISGVWQDPTPVGVGEASQVGKNPACWCRRCKRFGFDPWVGKIPWRRAWEPTPVVSPGESHGQRSLEGCSPQGHRESDTTEVT